MFTVKYLLFKLTRLSGHVLLTLAPTPVFYVVSNFIENIMLGPLSTNSPVADGSNLAMSGNNRFIAFLSTLDHVVQESIGCNDYPRLAFS